MKAKPSPEVEEAVKAIQEAIINTYGDHPDNTCCPEELGKEIEVFWATSNVSKGVE